MRRDGLARGGINRTGLATGRVISHRSSWGIQKDKRRDNRDRHQGAGDNSVRVNVTVRCKGLERTRQK